MKIKEQLVSDSLDRSSDFLVTHAEALGMIADLEGRKQIDAARAAIRDAVNDQGTNDRMIAGQVGKQAALIETLVTEHMNPIRLFARAKLDGVPDFAALTALVPANSINVVVRAARSMATAASKYMDQLTAGGFPPDAPQQILDLLGQIEAAKAERGHLRNGRVHSTSLIKDNLALGRDGVKQLHALIIKNFAGDEAFLTAWRSASRVYSGTATTKPASETPATPIATAPSTVAPVQPDTQKAA